MPDSEPEELCYRCHKPAGEGKTFTLITCPCGCSFDACQTCVERPEGPGKYGDRYLNLTDWAAGLSRLHQGTGKRAGLDGPQPPRGGCGRKVDVHINTSLGPGYESLTCMACKGPCKKAAT